MGPCSVPDDRPPTPINSNGTTVPSDLMTLSLTGRTTTPASIDAVELRGIQTSDRDALATAYLAAYPPGVAATSLSDAQQEMDDTFADEFGVLRHDLSRVATIEDRPVGAILVADKSIWDPQLDGPFIIDLFVHPEARGLGVGRALLETALHACARAGDVTLSLRVGEGTSPAALAFYTRAGFQQH